MFEHILLGTIQGIAEWLPVSSEGLIVLVETKFFGTQSVEQAIQQALFLHLGTFFAALIYLRKDVFVLTRYIFSQKEVSLEVKKVFWFLFVSTLLSGALGMIILFGIKFFEKNIPIENFSRIVTGIIAVLLFVTVFLQIRSKRGGKKTETSLIPFDGIMLGVAQGASALPGLSRSGLTVASLLLRKFDEEVALRLSFLMSLPIVLLGNIILNFKNLFSFSLEAAIGLFFSFFFGILTIHIFLKIAKKYNFGWFVLSFAILTFFSIFI